MDAASDARIDTDARAEPEPDAATSDGSTNDGATDDAALDAGAPGDSIAVPGERCALAERIGLIVIEVMPGSPPVSYVNGSIYDRPDPGYGSPALETDDCAFHEANDTPCAPCEPDEICGHEATCELQPRTLKDARVELRAGDDTQVFLAEPVAGEIYGQVTLEASAFALEAVFGDQRVTLEESALPSGLTNPSALLSGTYDIPESLDLTWDGPDTGHVFTHIPINHHAGGPTFTECTVPASQGELHVDGNMLLPLAVNTGLEFQGLEHVHFAAAETDAGCVEIRFRMQQYVSP